MLRERCQHLKDLQERSHQAQPGVGHRSGGEGVCGRVFTFAQRSEKSEHVGKQFDNQHASLRWTLRLPILQGQLNSALLLFLLFRLCILLLVQSPFFRTQLSPSGRCVAAVLAVVVWCGVALHGEAIEQRSVVQWPKRGHQTLRKEAFSERTPDAAEGYSTSHDKMKETRRVRDILREPKSTREPTRREVASATVHKFKPERTE
jgi:hypothetical protein